MSSSPDFMRGVLTWPSRRSVLAAGVAALVVPSVRAVPARTITVAAYPLVDQILKDAAPQWQQRHPDVAINVVMRQYDDHHTAMTTALSTSVYLPDVMALESSYAGKFANGGGLSDLLQPRYDIGRFRSRFVEYAYNQVINRKGQVVAAPTDIGPGTFLYRADILERAGVSAADMQRSWDAYVDGGIRIKKATGANLIGNVKTLKDIMIRSGLKAGQGLYFDSDSNVLVDTPRFTARSSSRCARAATASRAGSPRGATSGPRPSAAASRPPSWAARGWWASSPTGWRPARPASGARRNCRRAPSCPTAARTTRSRAIRTPTTRRWPGS